MSKFNLNKSIATAKFVVEKRKLPAIKAQVVMNIDVSGSTQNLFKNGNIQEAFQRILPIGILFDDNKEIDVFTFCDGKNNVRITTSANENNYSGYVEKYILNDTKVPLWGGTDYAPVIKNNLDYLGFFKTKKETPENLGGWIKNLFSSKEKSTVATLDKYSFSKYPAIIYMLTDGINSDQPNTISILQQCEKANTQAYFMFIGIGDPRHFNNIKLLGDKFSNVGFLNIKNLSEIESDDIYEQLLPEELCNWLRTE